MEKEICRCGITALQTNRSSSKENLIYSENFLFTYPHQAPSKIVLLILGAAVGLNIQKKYCSFMKLLT